MKLNNWFKSINFMMIILMVFHVNFPDCFILKITFIASAVLNITFSIFDIVREKNWFKKNGLFAQIGFIILILIASGVFILILYRIAYFIGYSL